jgi:hypothetical protein
MSAHALGQLAGLVCAILVVVVALAILTRRKVPAL